MLGRKLLVLVCLTSGCAAMRTPNAGMTSPAAISPEDHAMWSRPQEVGYELGPEIQGSAFHVAVLFGLLNFGSDDGGGVLGWIGGIVGNVFGLKTISLASTDPLTRAAAGDAVSVTKGADGIYVTQQQTSTIDLFLFKVRSTKVKGRSVTLKPLGEVSLERADRYRNLRALNGAELSLPAEFLEALK